MPDLRPTRRKLKIAFAVLGALDLAAVAVLFSPLVGSQASRSQQLRASWQELQAKTKQVEPLRGLDKKIVVAKEQIDDFYAERLPSQDSAVSEELGKVAAATGVQMGEVKYKLKDPDPVGLQPLQIEADFSGDYLALMKFINTLERDKVFFIIDSVQLGGEQAGAVKLGMKLETFLRTAA
jgi:type IV pilus assembly protein PilO